MSTEPRTRAWIEVRAAALRRNLARIRSAVGPEAALIPMIKADAYGLGLPQALQSLLPEDPWGWGVATVQEGADVRALDPDRPILVIAPAPPGAAAMAVARRLTMAISDVSFLERIAREADRQGVEARVHTEIDTGMGRAGFDWRTVQEWGPRVRELTTGRVEWEGCFTHFHSADESPAPSVELQAERFRDAVASLPGGASGRPGGSGPMLHLCNSAGALRRPELAGDAVRPGIFLYGARAGVGLPEPEPVVSLRARIALVREVAPGTTLGYGATYTARRWERWATVGIGYGDGLRRELSNRGQGIVSGRRVPIIGRISMDMTVVDITDVPGVEPGAPVTFLGADGDERITLEEVAAQVRTISYEILTGLTLRLPRVWLDEGSGPDAPGG